MTFSRQTIFLKLFECASLIKKSKKEEHILTLTYVQHGFREKKIKYLILFTGELKFLNIVLVIAWALSQRTYMLLYVV